MDIFLQQFKWFIFSSGSNFQARYKNTVSVKRISSTRLNFLKEKDHEHVRDLPRVIDWEKRDVD